MSDETFQVDEETNELVFDDDGTLDEEVTLDKPEDDKDKEIARLRKEAAGRRIQNKDVQAQLAELKALKERDMTELQKSQARLAELEAREAARVYTDTQRKVAKAVGLSMEWADRIRGDSEADMLDDAKSLLKKTTKGQQTITNRGTTGSPVGEGAPDKDWLREAIESGNFFK